MHADLKVSSGMLTSTTTFSSHIENIVGNPRHGILGHPISGHSILAFQLLQASYISLLETIIVCYKAEKQRKGKNPNSKAAKTKSNQNRSKRQSFYCTSELISQQS
jgi:hypothetical protein